MYRIVSFVPFGLLSRINTWTGLPTFTRFYFSFFWLRMHQPKPATSQLFIAR